MAWTTGTSTDWQDALNDLLTHAEANGWTRDRYDTSVGGDGNVDQWIAHGGDAAAPYIGIRTYYDSNSDNYGWELAGATGYNSGGSDWASYLPGISPGRYDGTTGSSGTSYGAYVPLQNTTISYWISSTNRRIIGVFKCGTTYSSLYMGLLNPYGTSTEYPYPLCIVGSTPLFDLKFNGSTPHGGSSGLCFSGLVDPIGFNNGSNDENGPMLVRDKGGVWRTVRNSREQTSSRSQEFDRVAWPCGRLNINTTTVPDPADRWPNVSITFQQVIPLTGSPGTEVAKLYKTPDSGGDLVKRFPVTLMQATDGNDNTIFGELDDVFWVSAAPGPTDGGVTSEDTLTDGGDTFHVFQQALRTNDFNYQAILQG